MSIKIDIFLQSVICCYPKKTFIIYISLSLLIAITGAFSICKESGKEVRRSTGTF